MEIELPDGTVLEAPDGSDPKVVLKGYRRSLLKSKNPAEYDPKSPEYAEKYGPVGAGPERYLGGDNSDATFREGIGSGMMRMTRGLGNLEEKLLNKHPVVKLFGGIKLPNHEEYTDEAIKAQDELDSPLSRTTRGTLGQATGQAAVGALATAPLGGLGAIGKGGSVLTRTLTNPTTRAALEGAVGGAGAADTDDQGGGAMRGALASAVISKFLQGGGRLLNGLVKKNEAVRDLEQMAGENLDIPISQAASDEDTISRVIRAIYQEGIPNVLGVKGRLARQSKEALAKARNLVDGDLGEHVIDEVFSEPVTRGTRTGKILTSIGIGGTLVYGDPSLAIATLLGGNAMASKIVQRALMGELSSQRKIASLIEKNPSLSGAMQDFIRSFSGAAAGESHE